MRCASVLRYSWYLILNSGRIREGCGLQLTGTVAIGTMCVCRRLLCFLSAPPPPLALFGVGVRGRSINLESQAQEGSSPQLSPRRRAAAAVPCRSPRPHVPPCPVPQCPKCPKVPKSPQSVLPCAPKCSQSARARRSSPTLGLCRRLGDLAAVVGRAGGRRGRAPLARPRRRRSDPDRRIERC